MRAAWVELVLLAAAAAPLTAQAPALLFSYRSASSTAPSPVSENGTITLPATAVGASGSVFLNITNQSTANWRLLDATVQGSQFTAAASTLQIGAGGSFSFPIIFTPISASPASATLVIRFSSPTGSTTQSSFSLAGNVSSTSTPVTPPTVTDTGSAVISYAFLDRGNNIPLSTGGNVPFPDTVAGARVTASIVVTNRGSSSTTVNAASISGTGFEMTGLPLLPAPMIAGGELRFNIAFVPTNGSKSTGGMSITIAGQVRTFVLSGQGLAGQTVYELINNGVATRLLEGSTIVFPSLPAGTGSSVVTLRMRNTGNGDSKLSGVILSGGAFLMLDQPAPPIVLSPGQDLTVRVQFTPLDVGDYTGQLRIDSVNFPLSGHGSGARLTAYLLLGEDRFLLKTTTRGVIPNTDVGGRTAFTVEIDNTGDGVAPVAAIQLSGEGFSLPQLPPLPTRIQPGQSLLLAGYFAPTQVGAVIGFLSIQDLSFQILGVGSDPPALPQVKFLGLPDVPQALQQPALAVELASPYPYDLTGTLRMSFSNDSYVDDPAIQFLNGLRTIDFRIPANSKRAIFGASAQEIRMQTGSLAGTITIVVQILTSKYDLTRNTPPVAVLNMPPAAPVIRAVEFVARASKSIELVITGAVTSRTLSKFTFKFTAKPGTKLQNTTLSADVARTFDNWFQSSNSHAFGGQFRASVVFDLTADFGGLDSIEVTAVNSLGTSAAKVVTVTTGN